MRMNTGVKKWLPNGAFLLLAGMALMGCDNSNYYDETKEGSGIFHGGSSYRLLNTASASAAYPPMAPLGVGPIGVAGSEIRIFTDKSYRGNLGKLTATCARRAGVIGKIHVNSGFQGREKFASLMPAANVTPNQQERTALCVEASIQQ